MEELAVLWSKNKYVRPFVIFSCLLIVFGSTFTPFHAITKNGAFILSGVFPVIAGWLLGLRLGLFFWFLHALLLTILARAVGSGVDEFISNGIPQYMVSLLITSAMGRISDLSKTLKHELSERKRITLELNQYKETLVKKVRERTQDLMQINEQLKQEILENEKINKEKLNLQTSLKRAEKMEAVGILAGSVAHDLNNILSGILSYPELLLIDIPKDSPLRQPLLTIQDSGKRAAAVVQDLLTLVRKEIIHSEVTDLNQIISDFLKSPELKRRKREYPGTSIETDLQADLPSIYGSPVHLSKVIMNLIFNSMEAMVKGGQLIISTKNLKTDKPLEAYEMVPEGSYVTVEISDTGDGISKKDLDRIFEPFYTKKIMGRSGTGLGLAIVWGTVKDHNGYVDVQSQKGEGTSFTLYFPATERDVSRKESNPEWCDYAGNGESILIIDDEKLQREVGTGILEKLGYVVHSVASGEAAIDYLKDNRVDLLILDMIMDGGIDGFETYKKVIEIHPGQKAVIVSGFAESEQVKKAQGMGAGAFIKKPYHLEKLGMAVKDELHRPQNAISDYRK